MQNVIELENGKSALELTTASYQRPNGHNIHRFPDAKETDEWGVRPNDGYELKLSDRELGRLVLHRRQRHILVAKPRGLKGNEVEKKDEGSKDEPKPDKSSQESDDKPATKQPADAEKKDEPKDKAEDKTDKPNDGKKGDDKNDDGKNDADTSQERPQAESGTDPQKSPQFVDRQLQKAIEYLTSELARAE